MELAFKYAEERGLPVDCYWVCPQGERFEASVTWNDKQVTRCILTPPAPPQEHVEVERDPEDVDGVWIVKHNDYGNLERKLMETRTHPPT